MSTKSVLEGLTRADRFFARLLSFDLECPACGEVYSVRSGLARKQPGKRTGVPPWDTLTARFTCRNKTCGRTYILGILAWPVQPGAGTQPPEDQIPTPRELARLRKDGGGWWLTDEDRQRFGRPHTTNLTLEERRPAHDDTDDD